MATKITVRKEREFLLRRADILAQAERIFATKGYSATTMAEIADASGFAIGSLYHFFQGKEHLYETLITEKIDKFQDEIRRSSLAADTALERVSAIVKTHFAMLTTYENFFSILIKWEGIHQKDKRPNLLEKLLDNYRGYTYFVESVLREGQVQGEFPNVEPRVAAIALIGMIDAFAFSWLISANREPLQDRAEALLDLFLRGVNGYGKA